MSHWYEPEDEDKEVDFPNKEVDIFLYQDHFGSVYVTLTFDQVASIFEKTFQGPEEG